MAAPMLVEYGAPMGPNVALMLALPDEILVHIANCLRPADLIRLGRTCHRLHAICEDLSLWRSLLNIYTCGDPKARQPDHLHQHVAEHYKRIMNDWYYGRLAGEMLDGSAHNSAITALAVSTCNKAITGSDDNTIRIWDLDLGRCETVLRGHFYPVTCVAPIIGNPLVVASGGADNTVRLWNTSSHARETLHGHTDWVRRLLVAGTDLISVGRDNTVRRWDTATGAPLAVLEGHDASGWCARVDPQQHMLFTGDTDGVIKQWDMRLNACVATHRWHHDFVTSLDLWGNLIASSSLDASACVVDLRRVGMCTTEALRRQEQLKRGITSIQFVCEHELLFTARDGYMCMIDVMTDTNRIFCPRDADHMDTGEPLISEIKEFDMQARVLPHYGLVFSNAFTARCDAWNYRSGYGLYQLQFFPKPVQLLETAHEKMVAASGRQLFMYNLEEPWNCREQQD